MAASKDSSRTDGGSWALEVTDALAVPVFAVDRLYRYTFFNSAHAGAMKAAYGVDVVLGSDLLSHLTVESDRETAKADLDRVLSGEQYTSHVWYGDELMSRRLYAQIGSPIREDGEVVGAIVIVLDETERRTTEEALRESEARFRAMFEQSAVGIGQLDMDGRWVRVNDRLCQMLGYSRAEMLELTFDAITYSETKEADVAAVQKFRDGSKEAYRTEKRYIRKDGSLLWVDLTAAPVYDADGKLMYFLDMVEDIGERKSAEYALRESEERFRAQFEQSAIGMAQVDLQGRWMQVNDRLCEMLGYRRNELLRLTFADITYPETKEVDLEALRRFQCGEVNTYQTEKRYIRKDGSLVWVDLMVSGVCDENGDLRYMLDMIEDIDERKRAEQALRESEERYRALVEAVRDMVIVVSADDRIEYVNEVAANWLGSTPGKLVGRLRSEVFPEGEDWAEVHTATLREVVKTGQPRYVEHPASLRGGMRWQATSFAPLHDADGRVSGVVSIARDITERKQAEQRRVGELEHLAHADALTGLLNRRGFDLLAQQALAQAERAGHGVGVIYADLDNLKKINDELGHAAGDQALRDLATVLRVTLRSMDVIARFGGDEFVVLATGEDEDSVQLLVERVQAGISVFSTSREANYELSLSCGVAWRDPGKHVKLDRLVAEADAAMYAEKMRRGRRTAKRRHRATTG